MSEEPRFDWGGILRSSGIIIGGAAVVGFLVPPIFTLAFSLGTTQVVADNVIYWIAYWAVAWGLTFVQGAWMLRNVGDKIIDDMLVIAIISALGLVILRFVLWLVYEPQQAFTTLDAGGALLLIVVALIGARTNRF
jgi:hypothetical protein